MSSKVCHPGLSQICQAYTTIQTLDGFNCDIVHPSTIKIQEPRLFQSLREDSELPDIPLDYEGDKYDRTYKTMFSLTRAFFGTIFSEQHHGQP